MTNISHTKFGPLSIHDVSLPDHLVVKQTKGNLLAEFNPFGYDGDQFFGCAFIQGKRLCFTTAMPVTKMLKISDIDRAATGGNVDEVMEHANRPRVANHGKALRQYFLKTACAAEKFILPAFTFNFGDEKTMPPEAPEAILHIYAAEGDSTTNGWPALFQLPNAILLDTTDGAHRRDEIDGVLEDRKLDRDKREYLRRNAVDVKIVFERKRVDAHQDFADCAKAKPITGSMISTFDVREVRNSHTVDLVRRVPFLRHYVDATAANVNLSANSAKIWSMSAVRSFVGHIQDHYPPASVSNGAQVDATLSSMMAGADEFFEALVCHLPQLKTLDLARRGTLVDSDTEQPHTPSQFRNKRGGNVALRGIGMSLFARAFVYAKEHGMAFDDVAERLGRVDWHLLTCERDDLPPTDTDEGRSLFAGEVRNHTVPTWASLVVVGESRYRIGSSNDEANQAWSRILAKFFTSPVTESVPEAAE